MLARLTADLPKLKAAVATEDPPTVQPLAAEYQQMLSRSSLVVVTDETGRLLAWAGPAGAGTTPPQALPSVPAALRGHPASSFRAHPEGLLQVLSVPITVGAEPVSLAGTLSVGFLLDRVLAVDFKQLTGSEIAFGLDGRIRASTLPAGTWPAIEQARRTGRVSTVSFAGDDYCCSRRRWRRLDPPIRPAPACRHPRAGRSWWWYGRGPSSCGFSGRSRRVIAVTVIVSMLLASS